MRIKMFALNSMEKKCMNSQKLQKALRHKAFCISKHPRGNVLATL